MGLGHYINNSWLEGLGEEFSSQDPSTGSTVWTGRKALKEEVDFAVEAATEALSTWSRFSFDERLQFLKKFQNELKNSQKIIAEAISLETGKPLWESLTEVSAMIQKIGISETAYLDRCAERKASSDHSTLIIHHKPHGVLAVLGPFNFPGHLPNGHIIPALLAGNTIVYKSSELTPLVAEEILKCWQRVKLPPGTINLVQGNSETGHYLASHSGIAGLCFTGSYKTGMILLNLFSSHPEKILALEMGGNNPLVVADIADLEAAAYLTIQSAYLTTGQRCSCARRLIVLEGKEGEEFLKTLTHMVSTILVGRYTDRPEPFMGPIINSQNMEKLLSAQAVFGSQGGIPLVEMQPLKEGTCFLSPGLMDVTSLSHRPDEELFGPFLQVIRVATFEEAIIEANKTQFGLTAALLSRNEKYYHQFLNEIKAGVINWNHQTTGASSLAPFGGVKKSGNHRPSAYYAADYSSYPISSIESNDIRLPKELTPGIQFLAKT